MDNSKRNLNTTLVSDTKKQDGITLIALIITIIVMLILVAVVVNTSINSNLFGHSKNAVQGWAEAERQEQELGNQVADLIKQYSNHNWKRTGENIKCDHCGLSFVIGDYVNYQPDKTTKTVTVTKEEAGLLETDRYSSEIIDSNTVSDQVFTQDEKSYWQILGIEDIDNDGINETLLIKMAKGTNTTLTLKGSAAYNNGPDIMNRIAKELYSSSKYGEARSITIEDVNNTLQYTPHGGFYWDSEISKNVELSGFNTQMKDVPTWNIIKENKYTPDGINTEEKLEEYKINGYWYILNSSETGVTNAATELTTNIEKNSKNVIFKTPEGENAVYWLACRGIHMGLICAAFGPGGVNSNYVYSCSLAFNSTGYVVEYSFSIAPVVPLKSEIPSKINAPGGFDE